MCSDARGSSGAAPTVSISSVTTGRGYRRHTPGMAARTILVVEDEDSTALPLATALEREGYATRVTGSAPEAIALAAELGPDLILLDVMLSDGSGLDVCREVRRHSSVPIIMLTARGDETDRVVGLELGADDYVVKPFSARELVARIRAVLRRVPDAAPAAPVATPEGAEAAL